MLIQYIEEAHKQGASYKKACEVVDITERTLQRWKKKGPEDKRKGADKRVHNKLSQDEREEIIDVCTSPRYRDLNPHQIVPLLLNENIYLASESSLYRILTEADLQHHRANSRVPKDQSKPPERKATASNHVWTWDITWLARNILGMFYYAYIVMDIYDRTIVGWAVHETESEAHAETLFMDLALKKGIRFRYLHSDNGRPMKGQTLANFLESLNVQSSFSRPRVSNDNPFIESGFRTLKYHPGYPKSFKSLEEAREWLAAFVNWYNTMHLHSSIGYVTPQQLRSGEAEGIFATRNAVMAQAKIAHPERWGSRKSKIWAAPETVTLNPVKKKA